MSGFCAFVRTAGAGVRVTIYDDVALTSTFTFVSSHYMRNRRSHLQPIVSASVACMKGDIKEAVYNFFTCRWCNAVGRRDTMGNSGADDEEDDGDEPRTNASNNSERSKRARRSSVFNSFLSWKVNRSDSMAHVRDSVTPRKVPMPPISSSGGITSEEGARSSVGDEDIFIDDEDATVQKDKGKKEGGGSTGDINV